MGHEENIARDGSICLCSGYETTIKLTILQSLNSAPPPPRAPRFLPNGLVDTLYHAVCKTEPPMKKRLAQRSKAHHLTHYSPKSYRISTSK